ncbi:uncharacterized protein LOC135197851 [Macrobrachium nipponense]|uniref:uncharacterized protein LOC135197851 n=1 Tax=Macrobrachium nipponense TaxID=159736 RepID=UPI0030C824B0
MKWPSFTRNSLVRKFKTKSGDEEKRDAKTLLEEIFAPGYSFPDQDTDDTLKVTISDVAYFGDIKDVAQLSPRAQLDGNSPTMRKFFPGRYKVTVLKLFRDRQSGHLIDPLVIFHHEEVDSNLLALQVVRMCSDYCSNHSQLLNSLSRHDWCHWTHYEEHVFFHDDVFDCELRRATDVVASLGNAGPSRARESKVPIAEVFPRDFRTLIYFARSEDAKDLKNYISKNQVRRSSVNKYVFSIEDDEGAIVSIGVNYSPFSTNEWVYSKVFEDTETGKCFALIVNGNFNMGCEPWNEFRTPEQRAKFGFTSVKKSKLKFPMKQFIRK